MYGLAGFDLESIFNDVDTDKLHSGKVFWKMLKQTTQTRHCQHFNTV
jgi:hypothetical protein